MSRAEVGELTRWEIFKVLFAVTDEDGQLKVDEQPVEFYEQMRDRALSHGFDYARAVRWAAEKARLKAQADEEKKWQDETMTR